MIDFTTGLLQRAYREFTENDHVLAVDTEFALEEEGFSADELSVAFGRIADTADTEYLPLSEGHLYELTRNVR